MPAPSTLPLFHVHAPRRAQLPRAGCTGKDRGPMQNYTRWIVVGAISLVVVGIALMIWFTVEGWWPVVVDIVLVITCLVSAVMLGALTFAVFELTRTVQDVRAELIPVLDSLKGTSTAVRETAKTAGAFGVAPAVRTARVLARPGEGPARLLGPGHANKRAQRRPKRRPGIPGRPA